MPRVASLREKNGSFAILLSSASFAVTVATTGGSSASSSSDSFVSSTSSSSTREFSSSFEFSSSSPFVSKSSPVSVFLPSDLRLTLPRERRFVLFFVLCEPFGPPLGLGRMALLDLRFFTRARPRPLPVTVSMSEVIAAAMLLPFLSTAVMLLPFLSITLSPSTSRAGLTATPEYWLRVTPGASLVISLISECTVLMRSDRSFRVRPTARCACAS
mmetsp:Transcript_43026/g.135021  ORF Transcript_43026/g.135021 Transcript_43026/m.135021 type:complete len:215 (-) Transcript_43026:207-851(-)